MPKRHQPTFTRISIVTVERFFILKPSARAHGTKRFRVVRQYPEFKAAVYWFIGPPQAVANCP